MADVKISQLTALASASADVAGDVLAIVDTSVPQTKKITIENLVSPITLDKSNSRVGIGATSPGATLHTTHSSSTAYNGSAEILESAIIQNTNGSDGSGVNNVARLGLQVASGATSQGFLNYVRTGDNTGKFTISQRNGSSTYAETFVVNSNADPVYITQYGLGVNCNNPGERSTSGTSQQYISVDGASNGGVVELVTSTNADDAFMGAVDWVNAANGDSSANNAAGRLSAAIRAYTDTDDSNASDDSGAHMLFYTKPMAGSLTLRFSINAEGFLTSYGHILPATNNLYDLGSSSKGWRNIYTNDLNLSNMESDGNDVDGTKGNWTIQEGEEDLFLINRNNGKKYKFKLEAV